MATAAHVRAHVNELRPGFMVAGDGDVVVEVHVDVIGLLGCGMLSGWPELTDYPILVFALRVYHNLIVSGKTCGEDD